MDCSIQVVKVREVARIKAFAHQNPDKAPSVSIHKSSASDRVVISFTGDQSTSSKQFKYEVDRCYDHEAGTDVIFCEEIKPLISSLFEGKSATIFAYGARGSGKTYTIQGTEDIPGLISLSMSELLSRSAEVGISVSISLYEVLQDRVFDVLDSKKPEVSVLEGAHGKIVLKGLSKASVRSMPEFQKLWVSALQRPLPLQKTANEPPQRSHIGIIIDLSSSTENASVVGRLNLVDLAGYEDKRQSVNGPNLLGVSIINKSLYAIHNVLHALRSNDSRVPYRESKLTRMLQDSLSGKSRILMITCMDPCSSDDTIKTLSLASRSSQLVNKVATTNVRNFTKSTMTPNRSSHTSKLEKVASCSASTKKQVASLHHSMDRKPQNVRVQQGRRLLDEFKSSNRKKEAISKKNMEAKDSSKQEEVISEKNIEVSESCNAVEEKVSENKTEPTNSSTKEEGNHSAVNATQLSPIVSSNEGKLMVGEIPADHPCEIPVDHDHDHPCLVTPDIVEADKENNSTTSNEVASPPLSARLQELSNNLKSLYTSTSLNTTSEPLEKVNSIKDSDKLGSDHLEPSTPVSQATTNTNTNTKCQYTSIVSPWERLQARSTGMKESLVKECLMFINSASKDELKGLKGIGEARANYIIQLRDESPEPFKSLEDLKELGLSSKQINGMIAGGLKFE